MEIQLFQTWKAFYLDIIPFLRFCIKTCEVLNFWWFCVVNIKGFFNLGMLYQKESHIILDCFVREQASILLLDDRVVIRYILYFCYFQINFQQSLVLYLKILQNSFLGGLILPLYKPCLPFYLSPHF